MKNDPARLSLRKRFHVVTFLAILMLAGAALILPFHSARSSSAAANGPTKAASLTRTPNSVVEPARRSEHMTPSAAPFFVESISTYDSDCTTPKTDFDLGEVVCVKATGVPVTIFSWRIGWVDTVGFIRQFDTAVADDNNTYTYTLPATPTSVVNDQTVTNVGTWRVNLARFNGQVRQTALFTVHEPANPSADVFVKKFAREIDSSVPSGNNIAFIIVVANDGPDDAANVHLVDSAPGGFSSVSFSQQSGPACLPAGNSDCTIASMVHGDRAEFTAVYDSGSSAQGVYSTSASVSSDTPDQDSSNNTSSAQLVVAAPASNGTCDLTCPSNVTVNADTTEGGERGAHVTYDEPASTGSCGSISSIPASGSFFPVGTTIVTATSETGGGSCTFAIIVIDTGNVSISCPANKQATADANCGATVSLGNPTYAGDNVTISVSRSDGLPMYDCDTNGENCVRKTTDLPFAAGTTVVTWTAISHDTPGPYATPEDEVAHRTGSASCAQGVTVNDVTPPTIMASNTSASADADCLAPVPDYSTLAAVSDNCACASSDTSQICDSRQDIVITQTPAPGTLVGLGPHTITLSANDGSSNNGGAGNTATIQVTFTVDDTTPPTFTFVPPTVIAYTGAGATTCDTVISDATIGTATATDNCGPVTVTRSPSGNTFPVGNTTITWTATDGASNSTTATQTVTVIDNTPPIITLNGQTPSMWPPNHKYQTFTVTNFVTSVFDNCGGVSVSDVVIDHVTSDETENGNGDGNTNDDIDIASNCKSVQLRSERDGGGDGRVYTITFRLRDTHGNVTTATARVVVQHNPGETPVDSGVHYTVNGTCP